MLRRRTGAILRCHLGADIGEVGDVGESTRLCETEHAGDLDEAFLTGKVDGDHRAGAVAPLHRIHVLDREIVCAHQSECGSGSGVTNHNRGFDCYLRASSVNQHSGNASLDGSDRFDSARQPNLAAIRLHGVYQRAPHAD